MTVFYAIGGILAAVAKAKVAFSDIRTEQSSLEDIFMGLVKA